MIRRRHFQSLVLLLCFCLVATGSFAVSPDYPREGKDHLWWAETLLRDITPGATSYQHTRDYGGITWKGYGSSNAISHTDCSGFMDELFAHTYGFMPDYMMRWLGGKTRPTANRYYAAIADQRGFIHVKKVGSAKPGDIIAVSYPYDKSNTGHVMLIAEAPKKITPVKPLIDGTEQWQVVIIDSSKSPHWKNDTRWGSDGKRHNGLGKGLLRLYTDSEGEIAGYAWSLGPKSEYHDRKERPLAIGRLDKKYHLQVSRRDLDNPAAQG